MKKMKLLAAVGLAVILISAVTVPALAADSYGSSDVSESGSYTLKQMLTYAIEDEYLAYAEYAQIIETYGAQRPFTNIIKAEETHIAELKTLFEEYDFDVPADTAAAHVIIPASIEDALGAGVQAEINNIAMYDVFLSQDLPDDVQAVFKSLRAASESHLAAFEKGLDRPSGNGTADGEGNGYGTNGQNGSASNGGSGNGTGTGDRNGTGDGYGNKAGDRNETGSGYGNKTGDCDETGSGYGNKTGNCDETGSGYKSGGSDANRTDTCTCCTD